MSDYRDEKASVVANVERLEGELAEARKRLEAMKPPPEPPNTEPKGRSGMISENLGCLTGIVAVLGLGGLIAVGCSKGWWKGEYDRQQEKNKQDQEAHERREASMTRKVAAVWKAHVVRSEGVYIPNDTSCSVRASARGNGKEIEVTSVQIDCGELSWERGGRDCTMVENPKRVAGVGRDSTRVFVGPERVYELACDIPEGTATTGRGMPTYPLPEMKLGTSTMRIRISRGTPSFLELAVERSSEPIEEPPTLLDY